LKGSPFRISPQLRNRAFQIARRPPFFQIAKSIYWNAAATAASRLQSIDGVTQVAVVRGMLNSFAPVQSDIDFRIDTEDLSKTE